MNGKQKIALLCLHGGPGLKDYLEPLFGETLSNEKVQAYFYTQKKAQTLTEMTEELHKKIRALSSSKIVLLGHSGGGPLALEYLRAYKDSSIVGLILISSPFNQDFDREFAEYVTKASLSPEQLLLSPEERSNQFAQKFLAQTVESLDEDTFNSVYQSYFTSFDLSELCSQLNFPSFMMTGDQDMRVTETHQRRFGFSYFKDCRFFAVPGAGHFPFILSHHRKVVVEKILSFLSEKFY